MANLDSWDNYTSGSFLKAAHVSSDKDAFVVIGVDEAIDQTTKASRVRLNLERNGQEYDFDLNKTNGSKLRSLGVPSPNALVGKKIYFIKALVRDPKKNVEVEGLRISKVE